MAADLSETQSPETLEGQTVTITKDANGVVKFATATVGPADVECSNGVIHVIDAVVLPPAPVDIVATALATGNHGVLAEALTKANLVTALQGTGPFTVFAPTDAAFMAALTKLNITKQELLDRADLADILKYHVISGSKLMAADLSETQSPETLEGQTVTITKDANGVVKFATATVGPADVECSNGVIHVIDAVVLPPAPVDIVATALATGNHGVLAEALTKANLVTALQGTGPFTVFAPTDAAFTAALAALGITKQELLDRADLADILKYHVISGSKIMAADLSETQSPETLEGQTVTITKGANGVVKFATATVGPADVECSNGVIHVIDAVVLPPDVSTTQAKGGGDVGAAYRSGVVVGFLYPLVLIVSILFKAG